MNDLCPVAIIGAGPYGLSLAAHLRARGIEYRIFGKPLGSWRNHMPKDMVLKSDGFASNLSAPSSDSTMKAWCAARNIPYADEGLPIPLDRFLAYADWFRARHVPNVEDAEVTALVRKDDAFALTLDTGETLRAARVVLAVGITWFAHVPDVLSGLPKDLLSHSYNHRDVDGLKGKDVVVIGSGASAIDLASLLKDSGARPRIVARTAALDFNSIPDPDAETLLYKIQRPASGIGRGWRSYFCATAPLLFYRLPDAWKQRAIASHMHPAAGWFMRQKVEGRIETLLGRKVANARGKGDRVALTLVDAAGRTEDVVCDHVIAATGYRADIRKLPFVSPMLKDEIGEAGKPPFVTDNFETRVPGLYLMGLAAMDSFGPLLRFMYGAEFAAPRVAAHLARKASDQPSRAA